MGVDDAFEEVWVYCHHLSKKERRSFVWTDMTIYWSGRKLRMPKILSSTQEWLFPRFRDVYREFREMAELGADFSYKEPRRRGELSSIGVNSLNECLMYVGWSKAARRRAEKLINDDWGFYWE